MNILGLSAFYHDSAAVILVNGKIVAACQEERFTRLKHDKSFPINSIKFCLSQANLELKDIDYICFYEKPFLKFERLLETFITYAPFRGFKTFIKFIPSWLEYKLNLKSYIKKQFKLIEPLGLSAKNKLMFSYHHLSHASSAYYPSPYVEAAVLCVDGVGEWETTSTWQAKGSQITPVEKINFPHSLGLLYSAFTYYCGFKVNSGEYKLMGLAPYGEPKYKDIILKKLIDLKEDGSFRLNMKYFSFPHSERMINGKFEKLFNKTARAPESEMEIFYKDIAASIQKCLEIILLKLVNSLHDKVGGDNLCLAGGVALNCVANSVLLGKSKFKNIWVQPAAGDAGGALGAALLVWHSYLGNDKSAKDVMQGCYLGSSYSEKESARQLNELGAVYERLSDEELFSRAVDSLDSDKILGWFSGRMEYGPRALGARSILADARSPGMQKTLNLKIKFRESFRPFAPITLNKNNKFKFKGSSPYMMFTAKVNADDMPAITHLDKSARLQTIDESNGPVFGLLSQFYKKTGCDTLINTSFNVRGEPIVESPQDAYLCFMNTHMDALVIDNFYLKKSEQVNNVPLPAPEFIMD